jgi:hypothetical protein
MPTLGSDANGAACFACDARDCLIGDCFESATIDVLDDDLRVQSIPIECRVLRDVERLTDDGEHCSPVLPRLPERETRTRAALP